MSSKKTLSIIKPDAIKSKYHGNIVDFLENKGFKILAHKKLKLSKPQAEAFYEVHKERPFYNDLVNFMMSGPVIVQVLEGENAVKLNRDVMGATNPEEADKGTIRAEVGLSIEANSVHGSDSEENAINEISFFFEDEEICP